MAWADEPSVATADDDDSSSSSSTLHYINSQLVAHGFVFHPGISLDGLSKSDTERVVKCLMSLLNQRIQDMERADDLNSRTRTMGYDIDRLKSMYQSALDKSSNAEKEMHLWKSRASAAEKATQASEKRFKLLTAENQRLRTMLQSVRTGAQTELKKVEKEKDKLLERIGKMADSKLSPLFNCTNWAAVNAPDSNIGFGRGYVDIALEDAESAREQLAADNDDIRKLVVECANGVQDVLHVARARNNAEEPAPLTLATFFPSIPIAREKFRSLLMDLQHAIELRSASESSSSEQQPHYTDIAKLQTLVENLRSELGQARSHTSDYATQAQALFDRYIEDKQLSLGKEADMSEDLMTAPARDEEQDRLLARSKELETDRRKLTEAAVNLGKERAVLEEQRLQFLEEQRGWEVKRMLADLPPTPKPSAPPSIDVKNGTSRIKSKTPAKGIAAKTGKGKKVLIVSPARKLARRNTRRSSKRSPDAYMLETEVITMPPPSPPPSRETIAKMTSSEELFASCSQGPKNLVLPTEFSLPPPSPQASLPELPRSTSEFRAPIAPLHFTGAPMSLQPHKTLPSTSTRPPPPQITTLSANVFVQPHAQPQTPRVQLFSITRPVVPHMVHAYSPVKPSPLSRILMMADDSPPSSTSDREQPPPLRSMPLVIPPLDILMEEYSGNLTSDSINKSPSGSGRVLTLEEELGIVVDEKPEDARRRAPMRAEELQDKIPLLERNARRSPSPRKASPTKHQTATTRLNLTSDAEKRVATARDKGKGREVETKPITIGRTRTAAAAGLDKENSAAKRLKPAPQGPTSTSATITVTDRSRKRQSNTSRKPPLPSPTPGARARSAANRTSSNRAGPPRRVPIGSSEAAPRRQ